MTCLRGYVRSLFIDGVIDVLLTFSKHCKTRLQLHKSLPLDLKYTLVATLIFRVCKCVYLCTLVYFLVSDGWAHRG